MRRLATYLAAVAATVMLTGCIVDDPEESTSASADDSDTAATGWSSEQGTVLEGSAEYCEIERATFETALNAYAADFGESPEAPRYPASLEELATEGYLRSAESALEWTYSSDGATYTLTGDC